MLPGVRRGTPGYFVDGRAGCSTRDAVGANETPVAPDSSTATSGDTRRHSPCLAWAAGPDSGPSRRRILLIRIRTIPPSRTPLRGHLQSEHGAVHHGRHETGRNGQPRQLIALVDKNKDGSKHPSDANSSTAGASGAIVAPDDMTAVVDISRASNSGPMLGKVWMVMTEDGVARDIVVRLAATVRGRRATLWAVPAGLRRQSNGVVGCNGLVDANSR